MDIGEKEKKKKKRDNQTRGQINERGWEMRLT